MRRKQALMGWFGAAALAALIFDSKTAMSACAEAVQMCITVLIPSLFPFFVTVPMVTALRLPGLRPLCRLLRLPDHAGGVLVSGLLGGYPAGAQAVSNAVRSGIIQPEDGRRMIAFCSNAGPAFLFGMGTQLFYSSRYCWLVWAIHLLSAAAVCILTPGHPGRSYASVQTQASPAQIMKRAVQTMGVVCGWVVLFRVILGFCRRWFLWYFPAPVQILISGGLELANGCVSLLAVSSLGQRLSYFAVFLSFGGICVLMQTLSVAQPVDTALYLPGKIAQCAASILLCCPVQLMLQQEDRYFFPGWVYGVCAAAIGSYRIFAAKSEIKGRNREAAVV